MNKKDIPQKPKTKPKSIFARSDSGAIGKSIIVSTEAETDEVEYQSAAVPDKGAGGTSTLEKVAVEENSINDLSSKSNTESSLYVSKDGSNTDWKEINFRVGSVEFVFTGSPDEAESGGGGGGLPPPSGSDPSEDSEEPDEDSEHSHGSDGGPLVGRNKFNSWDSEQTEQGEAFSDHDDDWTSPIYPDSLWKTLEEKGAPYFEVETSSGEIRVTGLNSCFFGGFAVLCGNLHLYHGQWLAFSESEGYWKPLNHAALLNLMHFAILHFCNKMQLPELERFATKSFCTDCISFMMPFPGYESIFDKAPRNVVNVKNGTVVINRDGSIILHDYSPEFLCRSRIEIPYEFSADYSDFVREAFGSAISQADIATLKRCSGQFILGKNISQTIVLIYGKAGSGKSTYIQLIEKILPPGSCEGLRAGLLDTRFEIGRFENKNLLIAPDEASNALMKRGASKLKALSGADTLTTERKCENEHSMISGEFNIILVSNARPVLFIDDDRDAWARRLVPVEYKGKPPKKPIRNYSGMLFKKYAESALQWMVEGAAELIASDGAIEPHPEMAQRIDEILQESDHAYGFVKTHVVPTGNTEDKIFSRELYSEFTRNYPLTSGDSKQSIQRALGKAMQEVYGATKRRDLKGSNGKAKYGYVGYRLIKEDLE